MEYSDLINELDAVKEKSPEYGEFQRKILVTQKEIMGVRTNELRKILKRHKGEYYDFKKFPNDIYEVAFIKVCLAAYLCYDEIVKEISDMVKYMDTWALTDTFSSPAVKENKEDFKKYIEDLLGGGVFERRLALVILLKYYVDKEDIPYALSRVEKCPCGEYYVSMAAAWLIAETIIRDYPVGVGFLKKKSMDKLTHNRAIQKCRDSFRLTASQKEELKALKRD